MEVQARVEISGNSGAKESVGKGRCLKTGSQSLFLEGISNSWVWKADIRSAAQSTRTGQVGWS